MNTIEISIEDGGVNVHVLQDITDAQLLDVLLSSYLSVARRIVVEHKCDDADCRIVDYTKKMIAAIQYEIQALRSSE